MLAIIQFRMFDLRVWYLKLKIKVYKTKLFYLLFVMDVKFDLPRYRLRECDNRVPRRILTQDEVGLNNRRCEEIANWEPSWTAFFARVMAWVGHAARMRGMRIKRPRHTPKNNIKMSRNGVESGWPGLIWLSIKASGHYLNTTVECRPGRTYGLNEWLLFLKNSAPWSWLGS
jgi:hypothetical protein